jgi:hypothetical protein
VPHAVYLNHWLPSSESSHDPKIFATFPQKPDLADLIGRDICWLPLIHGPAIPVFASTRFSGHSFRRPTVIGIPISTNPVTSPMAPFGRRINLEIDLTGLTRAG